MHTARLFLTAAAVLAAVTTASADQGALPVRPGDTVRGTLRRCGERHALELQLLRREVLRMEVAPEGAGSVNVRVFDPTGLDVSLQAERLKNEVYQLGKRGI